MSRGHQYYDPILQVPTRPEDGPKERIELYPEGDVTDAAPGPLRWVARLIGEDGRIVQYSPGSFDHDDALRQAQSMWPGLQVYELREESEDSTHEGFGPSPRLWQNGRTEHDGPQLPPAVEPPVEVGREPWDAADAYMVPQLRALQIVDPGTYVRVRDILDVLEMYAQQFDSENNPSAALGIREAANALKEAF